MDALAKIVALYLKVTGLFLVACAAGLFCLSVYMVFQPTGAQKMKARYHSEQSPAWFVQQ